MDVNIQHQKIELIQWLTTLDDESLVQKLIEIRNSVTSDWWSTISNDEKKSIIEGVLDADNGNLTPHSKARAIYERWL